MAERDPERGLPYPVPIEGYGRGGFYFGEMSHRGSLLCLPSGMKVWEVVSPDEVDERTLAPVFAEADRIDFLLIGLGNAPRPLAETLRWRLRDAAISVEVATTGQAIRTWNILLGERRRVAATLIAVD